MSRDHNFSAGPAVLPVEVVKELAAALPEYAETNVGLMEMSHRSQPFGEIIENARRRMRSLMKIPEDYEILFLQGGASMQFYMTALNLLDENDRGDYIDTGVWSSKAIKEAKRCSKSDAIWTSELYKKVPEGNEYKTSEDAIFLHYTSNNTIYGTQFHSTPESGAKALIVDMSSDICSRSMDVSAHDVIYAGAQKNLGPSGVTAVILSPWAVNRSREIDGKRPGGLPSMLNYGLMVDKSSMFNTPNTFGIFALERMFNWMESKGGLDKIAEVNRQKAELLYKTLDESPFWTPYADKGSRSLMNVTWRSPSSETDTAFVKEASEVGLQGLKGHRLVGGLRASIYNACPMESVSALVDFMADFARRHG